LADWNISKLSAWLMRISKSKFVAGVQCLKRLYLQVHEPGLAAKPDAADLTTIISEFQLPVSGPTHFATQFDFLPANLRSRPRTHSSRRYRWR
jgi:hypothetical protein